MIQPNITFFIQLINFLIILFVLNFLLYRPIRGIISKRTELMTGQLNDIERFTSQAEKKMADYEASLNEARRQGKELREDFRAQGYAEEKGLLEKASADASSYLQSAREEIEKKQKDAQGDLKGKIDSYAQLATEKVLGRA
ncbi:MAG: ATP synthase F0 subunit B [Desulfovibrionales bacterium]